MKKTAIFGLPRLLRRPCRNARGAASGEPAACVDGPGHGADGVAERLEAEVDEVRGAGELERDEDRLGGDEQRRQADARRGRPAGLAGGDACRGRDAGRAAAEQRVPDRQRRVLAGRDDHQDRDPEEGSELAHGQRLTLVEPALQLGHLFLEPGDPLLEPRLCAGSDTTGACRAPGASPSACRRRAAGRSDPGSAPAGAAGAPTSSASARASSAFWTSSSEPYG